MVAVIPNNVPLHHQTAAHIFRTLTSLDIQYAGCEESYAQITTLVSQTLQVNCLNGDPPNVSALVYT